MTEETMNWYYANSGKQIGPVSFDEIAALVSKGSVKPDTKVWSGQGDWQAAENTALSSLFAQQQADSNTPPPLAGTDVDNRYIWAVVAVPIIGCLIEIMVGTELIWLYILANIAFCSLDERRLKAAGHQSPTSWMIFIVPVYLWKRASLLKQKNYYFWGWIAAFILSIGISVGANEVVVTDTACAIVTDIIREQYYSDEECKAVTINEEVRTGFYTANAILDTGEQIFITIEEVGTDEISVVIPEQ